MSFIIEDDDNDGFGGGGGDIYDIDLGEPLGARAASSSGAAKRPSVSAAALRSTKVVAAGGGGAVTSVTDKASYYLAKLKADKAKAAAAAPRWVEKADGLTKQTSSWPPLPHLTPSQTRRALDGGEPCPRRHGHF